MWKIVTSCCFHGRLHLFLCNCCGVLVLLVIAGIDKTCKGPSQGNGQCYALWQTFAGIQMHVCLQALIDVPIPHVYLFVAKRWCLKLVI